MKVEPLDSARPVADCGVSRAELSSILSDGSLGVLPIVIGATGHHDLRPKDVPALEREVRAIFNELRTQYRHTSYVLLSALDEGGDRLIARVALGVGIHLIAIIPWPRGVWDEGLHRTGSREEFDGLLEQALGEISMPFGQNAEVLRQSEECRNAQYHEVGAYLARHSQILIGLWDGVMTEESGTARIIRWHESGIKAYEASPIGLLDEVERGPVYHIATPRDQSDGSCECVEPLTYPVAKNEEEDQKFTREREGWKRIWIQIDQFNTAASQRSDKFLAAVKLSRSQLFPENKQTALPLDLDYLLERYARSDVAALAFQLWNRLSRVLVFALILGAFFCFEWHSREQPSDPWSIFLGCSIVLLLLAILVLSRTQAREIQVRHLDYRALAEALRVQFFWRMAGLRESVADHYLRTFRSELDWIRQAVRSCNLVAGAVSDPAESSPRAPPPIRSNESIVVRPEAQETASIVVADRFAARTGDHLHTAAAATGAQLREVFVHWVEDQAHYFKTSGPKNETWHRGFALAVKVFGTIAIVLAIIDFSVHVGRSLQLLDRDWHHPLVVPAFLFLVLAGLAHQFAESAAYKVHAQKYEWMHSLFETARERVFELLSERNYAAAREVIRQLGEEAVAENADWVIQHRARPPRLPLSPTSPVIDVSPLATWGGP